MTLANKPFNLDAIGHDADDEPFVFTFGGDEYILPAHLDMRVAASLSANRFDDALRLLLGVEQWQRLQEADAVFDDRHLSALMESYGEHVGASAGESPASPSSSRSTVRPSKRTSPRTTKSR